MAKKRIAKPRKAKAKKTTSGGSKRQQFF